MKMESKKLKKIEKYIKERTKQFKYFCLNQSFINYYEPIKNPITNETYIKEDDLNILEVKRG